MGSFGRDLGLGSEELRFGRVKNVDGLRRRRRGGAISERLEAILVRAPRKLVQIERQEGEESISEASLQEKARI